MPETSEMGHRPHVYKIVQLRARAGESPNAHVPWVTAEIRVFWPAADPGKARIAFEQVVEQVRAELPPQGQGRPRTVDERFAFEHAWDARYKDGLRRRNP